MLCYRCGSNVPDKAMRCQNCGAELGSATRAMKLSKSNLKRLKRKRDDKAPSEIPFGGGDVIAERYEVLGRLGKGPFGVVFKTFDRDLETEAAVKVFRGDLFPDEEGRTRFEDAIRHARRLSHKNIVRVHESGFEKEHAYVAMQMLEGLGLRKVLAQRRERDEKFDFDEIERLVAQLCDALARSHKSGHHGDLKPENVVLLPDVLKVTDFYVAHCVSHADFVAGAGKYQAPETKEGAAAVDPRSDLWALGVLASELISGAAYDGTVILPSEAREDAAPELDAVIRAATSEDPANRQPDIATFSSQFTEAIAASRALAEAPMELDADEVGLVSDESLESVEAVVPVAAGAAVAAAAGMAAASVDVPSVDLHAESALPDPDGWSVDEAGTQVTGGLPPEAQTDEAILLDAESDIEVVSVDGEAVEVGASDVIAVDPGDVELVIEGGSEIDLLDEIETVERPRDPDDAGRSIEEALAAVAADEIAEISSTPSETTQPSEPKSEAKPADSAAAAGAAAAAAIAADMPDIFSNPSKAGLQKKSIMKPVGDDAPAPPPPGRERGTQNTERVATLPATKPRGAAVAPAERRSRAPLVLAILGIFLIVGLVGIGVMVTQQKQQPRTIGSFGSDGAPTVTDAEKEKEKEPLPPAPVAASDADAGAADATVVAAEADAGGDAAATPEAVADAGAEKTDEADAGDKAAPTDPTALAALTPEEAAAKKAELDKKAAEAKAEADKKAAEAKDPKADEEAKKANEAKLAEAKKAEEEARKADEAKKAEEARLAQEARKAEEERKKAEAIAAKKAEDPKALADKERAEKEAAAKILAEGNSEVDKLVPAAKEKADVVKVPTEKDAPTAQDGKPTCKRGMQLVRHRRNKWEPFCVDRYEFPGGGRVPKTGISWFGADQACKRQGKRLCQTKEWQRACGAKYPWGRTWNANKCNTEDKDELERSIAAAGSFKGCKARGIYDMVGNVSEWTAGQQVAGGDFRSGPKRAQCYYASRKSPGSSSGSVGFRCCADPVFK